MIFPRKAFWSSISLLICLSIAISSLSLRTIGFVPSDFVDAHPTQVPNNWQTPSPDTLLNLAEKKFDDNDIKASQADALNAISKNITSGGITALLMTLDEQQKQVKNAALLADFSDKLWPAHSYTRSRLADYWIKHNNLERILHEWNILLIHNPSLQEKYFPVLQNIVTNEQTRVFLQPYLKTPSKWWNNFFTYLVRNSATLEPISVLYQARLDAGGIIDPLERKLFVQRLMKEKYWSDAYFAWLSGLNESQIQLSGFIYDGGFESDTFNTGFDWNFIPYKNIRIKTSSTIGMTGRKALQILLDTKDPLNFAHISQYIKLNSGAYTLKYALRIDSLQATEGLKWRVRCYPNNKILGESKAIKDKAAPWSVNEFSFIVPDTSSQECGLQLLRLEASSSYKHQQLFQGSIWFDSISIVKSPSSNNASSD